MTRRVANEGVSYRYCSASCCHMDHQADYYLSIAKDGFGSHPVEARRLADAVVEAGDALSALYEAAYELHLLRRCVAEQERAPRRRGRRG